jgi:hypothetical protein
MASFQLLAGLKEETDYAVFAEDIKRTEQNPALPRSVLYSEAGFDSSGRENHYIGCFLLTDHLSKISNVLTSVFSAQSR